MFHLVNPSNTVQCVIWQQTMDVAKGFGHVSSATAVGGLVALAFGAWFSAALAAVYIKYEPDQGGANPACSGAGGGCSSGKVIGLIVLITFAGYWTIEWIEITLHSTIVRIYGPWFFYTIKPSGITHGATQGAFKRSMMYSFGSISFGSLVVIIIKKSIEPGRATGEHCWANCLLHIGLPHCAD